MTDIDTASGTDWLTGARYAVDNKTFVMVEPDGAWRTAGDDDWRSLEWDPLDPEVEGPRGGGTATVLDLLTASVLVQVHDAIRPDAQAKLTSLSIDRAVAVAWKAVG